MNDRLTGILLGTAVGDALGLPAEGLSPARRRRLLPGPWRHRLILGRGMLSDDTEHALFVAQSLLKYPADAAAFQRQLAQHVRWWFAALPAGIGLATAKACLRLWLSIPPDRSGVYSTGNGPAVRSAILGGYFHADRHAMAAMVEASTRLTHTHPRALTGALAVARVAAWAVEHRPAHPPRADFLPLVFTGLSRDDPAWCELVERLRAAHAGQTPVNEFAVSLGLEQGVSGYIYETVPVAVYAWLRHYGNFRATLEAALDCGGDADTVGAIAGGLAGATVGAAGIPQEWLRGIIDWPRSVRLLRAVGERLEEQLHGEKPLGAVRYPWLAVLPRNLVFLLVVVLHGFRRLAPPYGKTPSNG